MRRPRRSEDRGKTDYWQSYSDMMAALLLMFILIMALTLVRSLRTFEEKNADLERQRLTIEAQQTEIQAQQEKIDAQKSDLADLTQLIGVKSDIIEDLKGTFQNSELSVMVDEQTGAITFDAGILFQFGKSDLSQQGRAFLQNFVPQYLSVLLGEDYRDSISEIIIEGHTDMVGDYMINLMLSQNRASSVAAYCLNEENAVLSRSQIEFLKKILTANGRSFSSPIYDENGNVDPDASRRVVFKFRLKDDEMISGIQKILGDQHD